MRLIFLFSLFTMLIELNQVKAQSDPIRWSAFPSLPDSRGFASMYAGESHGVLLAMGGANFPEKYPWEGGVKKWYDHIYAFSKGKWLLLKDKLPQAAGYGVTVSYNGKVILAGGSTPDHHLTSVFSYEWNNGKLTKEDLPSLPEPVAYMTGGVLGECLVIFGGTNELTGPPLSKAFLLDLSQPRKGWQSLETWPGPARTLPASGVFQDRLFLMSGENSGLNAFGEKYRNILLDNYELRIQKDGENWKAVWKKMAPIPRGVAAAGTLPLIRPDRMLIWGGVDGVIAQYRTPQTHPGIGRSVLYYNPQNDTWEYAGDQPTFTPRVTLAVVPYQSAWLYLSGEVKPGIRTPTIVEVR